MKHIKYLDYKGVTFCRDETTGYYLNSTIRKRMHAYVWECEVGEIPVGCQIHHMDGNKANNSIENLCIMTTSAHQIMHGKDEERKQKGRENIKKAQAKAVEWHKSNSGTKWHSEQGKANWEKREIKKYICTLCGQEFETKNVYSDNSNLFCSNVCRAKHRRNQGADDIERVCVECGKPFLTNKYKQIKCCSAECKGKQRTKLNQLKRDSGIAIINKIKK